MLFISKETGLSN